MSSDERADCVGFWRDHLNGQQFTQLPALWRNDVRPDDEKQRHACQNAVISYSVTREVILCAWTRVLSLFTGLEDITYGVVLDEGVSGLSDRAVKFPFCGRQPTEDELSYSLQSVADLLQEMQAYHDPAIYDPKLADEVMSLAGDCRTMLRIRAANSQSSECVTGYVNGIDEIPIVISFQPKEHSTNVDILFHEDVFRHEYVSEVLRQTLVAIDKLLARSDDRRDEEVKLDLVLSWTQQCEPVSDESLLQAGIEKQSQLRPTAIAIGESERAMTYQELNVGADLLADHLESKSLEHDTGRNIGIYFEKSAFAIMSMLAVLKMGKTYVPLDVAWPSERISSVIGHARISRVICSRNQSVQLPKELPQVVTVDEEFVYAIKRRWKRDQHRVKRDVDPSTPAYMLYTSGSTGTPKGIPVSHSAIVASIHAMARKFNIDPKTRTFQYTTFTFDLNIADLWMTLSYGGRICLPTEDERLRPGEFIAQERCNYAMITPTAASTIDTVVLHQNIETLALIGEAVPESLLRRIATPDGSLKLYNTWGPTEASVIASSSKCLLKAADNSSFLSLHPNNIGYPVGCSVFIVCPKNPRRLASAYAPGEIALVGHTLADGYYDDPARTDLAFRTDLTWWTENKALQAKVFGTTNNNAVIDTAAARRVYLTGDVGRYNSNGDGSIIFMYRKEGGYVKVNGYRIDPGEIESKISELGGGEDLSFDDGVCVLAHDQQGSEAEEVTRQILVCFFVIAVAGNQDDPKATTPAPGAECEMVELKPETKTATRRVLERLRQSLPEYMVPRLFVPLKAMPVLTSHKIDRKALSSAIAGFSRRDLIARYGC